jgi:hypothetical protein
MEAFKFCKAKSSYIQNMLSLSLSLARAHTHRGKDMKLINKVHGIDVPQSSKL